MADQVVCTTPIIGVDFNRRTSTQEHKVGMVVTVASQVNPAYNGALAMYVKSSGGLAANNYCTVDLSTVSCLITSVDGGAGTAFLRNGSVAFSDLDFGWVRILKRAPLYTGQS